MKFAIKEGYRGLCAVCMKADATHDEYCAFDKVLPVPDALKGLMEPVTGVWEGVCDKCCDLSREHKS